MSLIHRWTCKEVSIAQQKKMRETFIMECTTLPEWKLMVNGDLTQWLPIGIFYMFHIKLLKDKK